MVFTKSKTIGSSLSNLEIYPTFVKTLKAHMEALFQNNEENIQNTIVDMQDQFNKALELMQN